MPYGYDAPAAPVDAWRTYDLDDPDPGYGQFDWLSARHPDLYDRFARSTDGLMEAFTPLVDLAGRTVVDVGAGTGRSALAAARTARRVWAVDVYASVVAFGAERVAAASCTNVTYLRADRVALPFPARSVDVVLAAWAVLDLREAVRVVRPGGVVAQLGSQPDRVAGELTSVLGLPPVPPDEGWTDLDDVRRHDLIHRAEFESVAEAAAIHGRLYGPPASAYLVERDQRTVDWPLRITWARVAG